MATKPMTFGLVSDQLKFTYLVNFGHSLEKTYCEENDNMLRQKLIANDSLKREGSAVIYLVGPHGYAYHYGQIDYDDIRNRFVWVTPRGKYLIKKDGSVSTRRL